MTLRHLRLIAVNIDGVLLNDTFSPVIHRYTVRRGRTYTAQLEHAVLSRPQLTAAAALGGEDSPQEVIRAYFREREQYLEEHPVHLLDGAGALLDRLRTLGTHLICYGGLKRPHFERHLAPYTTHFDEPRYICTDQIRPGIREITEDIFHLRCDQALFIDDAAHVAETARSLGAAFIGHPTTFEHSFQEQLMRQAGVRHLTHTLHHINETLLHTIDTEAANGHTWPPPHTTPHTTQQTTR
ncbi:HAD family phosphatase [Streptomyces sp. NPDC060000]|uniref:HAD family phosphatase n=1 Tax=Streptomyces sp. NPDC060000 TaxID=3347031 RepID=UPI00368B9265